MRWLDERLGTNAGARYLLAKIYPDHWSFYLGEFALYFFMSLVATGIWLTFAYDAAPANAYGSVLELTNHAHPIGYVIRQVHHWSAVCFVAAILVHLGRMFFTGAFRKPRELNWMVGVTMLALASMTGFTGYSLPNDSLSGTGLRIADSVALSIPFVGAWAASVLNGADTYPGPLLLPHLYTLHVYYLPIAIATLLALHLGMVIYQKHTQFARDPRVVVGRRFWPDYALRTLAVLGATGGGARAACLVLRDQPDRVVRAVPPVAGDQRRGTRLVHGVSGRRAAPRAGDGDRDLRASHSARVLAGARAADRGRCCSCCCGRSSSSASRATRRGTTSSTRRRKCRCASASAPR